MNPWYLRRLQKESTEITEQFLASSAYSLASLYFATLFNTYCRGEAGKVTWILIRLLLLPFFLIHVFLIEFSHMQYLPGLSSVFYLVLVLLLPE